MVLIYKLSVLFEYFFIEWMSLFTFSFNFQIDQYSKQIEIAFENKLTFGKVEV